LFRTCHAEGFAKAGVSWAIPLSEKSVSIRSQTFGFGGAPLRYLRFNVPWLAAKI